GGQLPVLKTKRMAHQKIERKFLVTDKRYATAAQKSYHIMQGYLNSAPERSVRVRIKGDKGFLTIKGKSSKSGASRFEWEKEIPKEEARALLELCEPGVIEKERFIIPFEGHVFEVDEFAGQNKGLTLAEVELTSEKEPFKKPNWLGREVTGDPKYYNARLSQNPFSEWD